jgi:site-specific DNA-methyltransferase (adenine-specific)
MSSDIAATENQDSDGTLPDGKRLRGTGSSGRAAASLGIHDPPYNITVGRKASRNLFSIDIGSYLDFSRRWISNAVEALAPDSSLYIWTGADQERGFQPLPELIHLLREFHCLESRSLITLRNQRGYGTGKNWMCVRQELLYYVKGNPIFSVQYTDIPKILRGYYKEVGGIRTENSERGKSPTIRPGNVWVDIQQVFYRLPENVPGAYAQKPLKAVSRIIQASSLPGDVVTDFFSHSGTTLLAAEITGRRCYAAEIDPVFAELSIRRLEHFRETGKPGFQCANPFPEWSPGRI